MLLLLLEGESLLMSLVSLLLSLLLEDDSLDLLLFPLRLRLAQASPGSAGGLCAGLVLDVDVLSLDGLLLLDNDAIFNVQSMFEFHFSPVSTDHVLTAVVGFIQVAVGRRNCACALRRSVQEEKLPDWKIMEFPDHSTREPLNQTKYIWPVHPISFLMISNLQWWQSSKHTD